jgi:hypothetical protein
MIEAAVSAPRDRRHTSRDRTWPRRCAGAVTNDLPFQSARQVDVPREHVAGIDITLARVTVAFRPARITPRIAVVLVGIRLPGIVTGTAAKFVRVVVAVATAAASQSGIVIAIEIIGGVATSSAIRAIIVSRVGVARIEIHIAALSG